MIYFIPYYREQRKTIVIRIISGRVTVKAVNTGIKVESNQWDATEKKVVNHPNKKIFNQKIVIKIGELQQQIIKADLLGVNLTKDRVKKIVEGAEVTTVFYDHCEKWIKEKYTNTATQGQQLTELRKVHAFAPSLQFGDIDKRWLMSYHRHLVETIGNKGNTPWKGMKFIRTMIYDAQSMGLVHINPFQTKEYKMPKYIKPEKDGLYLEELDRIEGLLNEPHPVVVKIMAAKFLFMCYTGLRVSDAKRFTDEHLVNGRIVMTHKKTGITTKLAMWGRLERTLLYLKSLPQKSISDSNLNKYLKTIAELSGVDRLILTTHVGRHTFGCLLAESGVSEEEAMELMGHKTKTTARTYFKLRQAQIDKAASKLNTLK